MTRLGVLAIAVTGIISTSSTVAAQAWLPPAHVGSITFTGQRIDNIGHFDEASFLPLGKSTDGGIEVGIDYGLTDRLSVSGELPFVFARFIGPDDGPPGVPFRLVDKCRCWNYGFQDLSFTAHYNLIRVRRVFALTPSVAVVLPSHNYDPRGEAVLGRHLTEMRVAVDASERLDVISPRLTVQGGYSYAVVERAIGIAHNRSNVSLEGDVSLTRQLTIFGTAAWQRTHGGLRFPSEVMFDPDRIDEHDRLLRDNYVHLGGGVSYSLGKWQLSGAYIGYASGRDTHDLRAITVSIGRLFERGR